MKKPKAIMQKSKKIKLSINIKVFFSLNSLIALINNTTKIIILTIIKKYGTITGISDKWDNSSIWIILLAINNWIIIPGKINPSIPRQREITIFFIFSTK